MGNSIGRALVAGVALLLTAPAPAASSTARRPTCLGHAATIVGTSGPDRLTGTGRVDVIVGLGGRDAIHGGRGGDVLCGGDGDDEVIGEEGDDRLAGNAGSDSVSAGGGADLLLGGSGSDYLSGTHGGVNPRDAADGGSGSDVCVEVSSGRSCEKTPTRKVARAAHTTLVAPERRTIDTATGAGDVDGDDEIDLLLGSAGAARAAGVVTLLPGPLDRTRTVDLRTAQGAIRIRGAHGGDEDATRDTGDRAHLVDAGDVDGDGLSDVIVGAPGSDVRDLADAGRVYVIFGRRTLDDVDLATFDAGGQGDAGFQILGPGEMPDAGSMDVAFLGDVDGDGLGDVAAGWRFGHVYVAFGKTGDDPVDLRLFDLGLQGDAGYRIESATDGNRFDVAAAGDVDGDDLADVVFSRSRWYEDPDFPLGYERAATWISYGKAGSSNVDRDALDRTGTRIEWSHEDRTATGAGDVDGDGFDDVALGNIPSYGTVKVLFGAADLRGRVVSPAFRTPFEVDTRFELSSFGDSRPVALGDADGDGLADFAFATTSHASVPDRHGVYGRAGYEAGSVFTVLGSRRPRPSTAYALGSWGSRLLAPGTDCRRSCSLAPRAAYLGDVDGNGADDVFLHTFRGDRGFVVLSR